VLERTLTDGIVSALARKFGQDPGTYFQVTAAINPGNSGGPIFDYEGKVVGVSTLNFTPEFQQVFGGLELSWVREILSDPSKSLSPNEIRSLLERVEAARRQKTSLDLLKVMEVSYKPFTEVSYRIATPSNDLRTSVVPLNLEPSWALMNTGCGISNLPAGYDAVIIVLGTENFQLAAVHNNGYLLQQDPPPGAVNQATKGITKRQVSFKMPVGGHVYVYLQNQGGRAADCLILNLYRMPAGAPPMFNINPP
jgi:hypothetical protein